MTAIDRFKEPVIGLEVHIRLSTQSKLFCGCRCDFGGQPNTRTCPVCLGLPGALPVLNGKAVEHAVQLALALHCTVRRRSFFSRKNYFYPDLPKGYQITQYEDPLAEGGWLDIDAQDTMKRIRIRRIHLEEDAGKSVHDEAYVAAGESYIDYNRCGVPLAEVVTRPDFHSPREARIFLEDLRTLIRWLGVSDGNMDQGSLRCDANISLRERDGRAGAKVELKNLNSFRAVDRSLAFEIIRQASLVDLGIRIVPETRLWDEKGQRTVSMRGKESSEDYRYFREPDLPPLEIDPAWLNRLREGMPELPRERAQRWKARYGISADGIRVLNERKVLSDYFERMLELGADPIKTEHWMTTEVLGLFRDRKWSLDRLRISPEEMVRILQLIQTGRISHTAGKQILESVLIHGGDPDTVMRRLKLTQVSDAGILRREVRRVCSGHPDVVEKYRKGQKGVLGFLVGQVMKATGGRANPRIVQKETRQYLEGPARSSTGDKTGGKERS
jgi:aspartyl-tRNA(Asn)/glutamyl-tRNA(Gln) amidotransferase subunit B